MEPPSIAARISDELRRHRDVRVKETGDGASFLGRFRGGLEFRGIRAGDLRDRVQVNRRHRESGVRLVEVQGRLRLDALGPVPRLAEFGGESHRKAARVRGGDEFLWIRPGRILEPHRERVRDVSQRPARRGHDALSIFQSALPLGTRLSLHGISADRNWVAGLMVRLRLHGTRAAIVAVERARARRHANRHGSRTANSRHSVRPFKNGLTSPYEFRVREAQSGETTGGEFLRRDQLYLTEPRAVPARPPVAARSQVHGSARRRDCSNARGGYRGPEAAAPNSTMSPSGSPSTRASSSTCSNRTGSLSRRRESSRRAASFGHVPAFTETLGSLMHFQAGACPPARRAPTS